MKINEITALAVNKWAYIFNSLGIEVGNGKHCACPVCGVKIGLGLIIKAGEVHGYVTNAERVTGLS